jgi:hypothetical protein
MLSVYDGQRCLGHIIKRGKCGFEAFMPMTTAWASSPAITRQRTQ